MSTPEPRPDPIVSIGDRLVDFSPPVLDLNGEPLCTCTHGAQCITCYEESL
ncbi:hypothetical protein [Streptomyces sp. H27-H5]|uniref:hypothetical protein n=1 Tax=Streptomyces sp. H27-H5 TaxID=2996460 RepID=UPI00226EE8ED|nr:hypothetical protein [Streptomyces sp. H27-H5]MCY0960836.1 hypothetical protein [Streptomyces sp. H27-H5]